MGTPLIWVDVFTDTPFRGNPAAIPPRPPLPEPTLQALAFELGLAETAYLVPRPDGAHDLRWFTPTVEIPLWAYATLASAHALFESGRDTDTVTFHTLSGPLTCTRLPGGHARWTSPWSPEAGRAAPGLLTRS